MGLFSSAEGEEVGVRVCSCGLLQPNVCDNYRVATQPEVQGANVKQHFFLAITHWTVFNELTLKKNSEMTRIYDSCSLVLANNRR